MTAEVRPKRERFVFTAGNMPEAIIDEWEYVRSAVADVDWHWTFHSELCGNKEDVTLLEGILLSPLTLIASAMKSTICLAIGRILDTRRDVISFRQLLRTIARECPSAPNNLYHASLGDIRKICAPILVWRHNRYGHSNYERILESGPQSFPDVPEEVFVEAISKLRRLLEVIHAHFNGVGSELHFPPRRGDAERLMYYVRKGREAEIEETGDLLGV